ncbi:hypothetical protein [Marinicellulosiphila megalodicopiae]|uniref:hypothetical protein n=1 Tax=Marinicellulosiphila megalodicopiae TaxID=2724896 RepID=UPI003BB07063
MFKNLIINKTANSVRRQSYFSTSDDNAIRLVRYKRKKAIKAANPDIRFPLEFQEA